MIEDTQPPVQVSDVLFQEPIQLVSEQPELMMSERSIASEDNQNKNKKYQLVGNKNLLEQYQSQITYIPKQQANQEETVKAQVDSEQLPSLMSEYQSAVQREQLEARRSTVTPMSSIKQLAKYQSQVTYNPANVKEQKEREQLQQS